MTVLGCLKLQDGSIRLDGYSGRILCCITQAQLQNLTWNFFNEIRYLGLSETVPEKCDKQRRTVPDCPVINCMLSALVNTRH